MDLETLYLQNKYKIQAFFNSAPANMTNLSELALSAFWRVLPQDADPIETREWLEAFDAIIKTEGAERATFILRKLIDQARASRVPLPPVMNTPYCNTISLADQPPYPGNLEVESRLSALVRWNALAMVVRANKAHPELGGISRPMLRRRIYSRSASITFSVRGKAATWSLFRPTRPPACTHALT